MTIGITYAQILELITSWMKFTSHCLISFRFMATGSFMVATPKNAVSGRTQFLWHGALLPWPIFWKAVPTPQNLADPNLWTSTSACPISSKLTHLPTCWRKSAPLGLVVADAKGSADSRKGQCLGNLIKIVLYFCLHFVSIWRKIQTSRLISSACVTCSYMVPGVSYNLNPLHSASIGLY